jgi:hypothetical protein
MSSQNLNPPKIAYSIRESSSSDQPIAEHDLTRTSLPGGYVPIVCAAGTVIPAQSLLALIGGEAA